MADMPTRRSATSVAPAPSEPEVEVVDFSGPPSWATRYKVAKLPQVWTREPDEPAAQRIMRDLVLATVREEAPITEDLLIRRVIAQWNVSVTSRRRRPVLASIDHLLREGSLVETDDALHLPDQDIDIVRVPLVLDERTQREVKHVPRVELAQALLNLVVDAQSVAEDELLQLTARLFGWSRRGGAIQASLNAALADLVDQGWIERNAGTLRPIHSSR